MNVFARIRGRLVTPTLDGTILAGVTRDCAIALCRELGLEVEERRLALDELVAAHRAGTLEEVFGTGTAALAAPIGELAWGGERLALPDRPGSVAGRVRDALSAIQRGEAPDRFGWLVGV
jgi:branched-chain amino acid aminotransferase